MKHTKGQWVLNPINNEIEVVEKDQTVMSLGGKESKEDIVTRVCKIIPDGTRTESKANAKLIEQAPNLLMALISAKETLDKQGKSYNMMTFIEDTINKATE